MPCKYKHDSIQRVPQKGQGIISIKTETSQTVSAESKTLKSMANSYLPQHRCNIIRLKHVITITIISVVSGHYWWPHTNSHHVFSRRICYSPVEMIQIIFCQVIPLQIKTSGHTPQTRTRTRCPGPSAHPNGTLPSTQMRPRRGKMYRHPQWTHALQ